MPSGGRVVDGIRNQFDFSGPPTAGAIVYNPLTNTFSTQVISVPVTSVNTLTGNVLLSTTNIPEGTNLYFTNARAIAAVTVPIGANPSASIGLAAVNGVATTFLRSDAAPALSQSITPTWSGLHTFTGDVLVKGGGGTLLIEDRSGAGVGTWNVFSVGGALSFYASGLTAFTIARDQVTGQARVAVGPIMAAAFSVTAPAPNVVGLVIKLAPLQSANAMEVRDSNDVAYATVSENGYFTTRKNTAPADAELSAGEAAYWFDSTNGAAKFMVKAKQADGTVRTGSLALMTAPGPYTPTNVTTDRAYNANVTTLDELADIIGTLIADLQSLGLIS